MYRINSCLFSSRWNLQYKIVEVRLQYYVYLFFHISLNHDYPYDAVDIQNPTPVDINTLIKYIDSTIPSGARVCPSSAHGVHFTSGGHKHFISQEKLPSVESIEALAVKLGWLLDVFRHKQVFHSPEWLAPLIGHGIFSHEAMNRATQSRFRA